MQQLTHSEFVQAQGLYDEAVSASSGIDPFCSRTDWIFPFHAAFTPGCSLRAWQEGGSFIALSQSSGGQQIFSSVDSMWGFASALIGGAAPEMLGRLCRNQLRRGHLILYGMADDRSYIQGLARLSQATHLPFLLNPVSRCVASLAGGMDGFLARRTRKFRVNARREFRRAEQAGLQFRHISALAPEEIDEFYDLILAIERLSWKGLRDEGADKPPMRDFYRAMLGRIGPAGALRAIMAELDGAPVGYIYGAVVGGRFRGLQFSFDDRRRDLSIGKVLQLHMLRWMCRENISMYDLGMSVPYKKSWAELEQNTQTLYLRPL